MHETHKCVHSSNALTQTHHFQAVSFLGPVQLSPQRTLLATLTYTL